MISGFGLGGSSGFWVLVALLAASVEPILAKLGYRGSIDPWQLQMMKSLAAAAVIVPMTRRLSWVGWGGLRRMAPVAVLLLFTSTATLLALRSVPAVLVITCITATPALVALVNQRKGRERLTWRFWTGFALAFLGVVLTLREPALWSFHWGGMLALGAAVLSSTIYRTTLEDVTARYEPALVSSYIFLLQAPLVLLLLAPWVESIPASAYPLGLWLGIAAAAANVAFLWGLHLLGSTNMSMFNLLQRPLVILAAALILGESMAVSQWAGVLMVLVGVQLGQVRRPS